MSTDTLTDNELIAEFMDEDFHRDKNWHRNYWKDMPFDQSWEWLMPVVEKIESLGYYTNIFRDEDGQQTAILHPVPSYNRDESSMIVPNDPMRGNKSKIDTTYKAVVEFIKWYNQQPK